MKHPNFASEPTLSELLQKAAAVSEGTKEDFLGAAAAAYDEVGDCKKDLLDPTLLINVFK